MAGSAGFLAIFLVFFVDTSTIGDVLRDANYAFVAPSLVFYFIALYLRAHRWRFLLRPIFGESRRPIFPVVVVGYMANNLIPVRIGEVVRSYYLSLREDITTAGAFGTVAVERASDVLALLFFVALAWTLVPVSGAFGEVADNVPGGAATLAAAALLPFLLVAGVVVVVSVMSKARGDGTGGPDHVASAGQPSGRSSGIGRPPAGGTHGRLVAQGIAVPVRAFPADMAHGGGDVRHHRARVRPRFDVRRQPRVHRGSPPVHRRRKPGRHISIERG